MGGRSDRLRLARWVAVTCTVPWCGALFAQSSISGKAIALDTSNGVAQAEVVLLDDHGRERLGVVTDSAGHFRIPIAVPGSYALRVRHIAYSPFVARGIRVNAGEDIEVELHLKVGAIALDPLEVTARRQADLGILSEFYDRLEHGRRSGFGKFFTRTDIEHTGAASPSTLLSGVAGVTAAPVATASDQVRLGGEKLILMRGAAGPCLADVFVDGVAVRQFTVSTIDDYLKIDYLEGVEVYTSGALVPARYRRVSAGCGAVLFWTRRGKRTGSHLPWERVLFGLGALGSLLFLVR